ncbi:hypothetical protein BI317_22515 [Xanthomonas hortorum pv. gardneri]|nr:hypothetical protein BI317_22515 [Xanthomonas hortorum pv. gardneri]
MSGEPSPSPPPPTSSPPPPPPPPPPSPGPHGSEKFGGCGYQLSSGGRVASIGGRLVVSVCAPPETSERSSMERVRIPV